VGAGAAQLIFLGVGAGPRLVVGVPVAEVVTQIYTLDLSAYPRWLLILAGTLALAVAIWILMKILKWTLWLLLIAVMLGGFAWAAWELLR
jgi:hypothetical protein